MEYLITGGAGFIGSTLADRLLAEGNKVIVVDCFNDYYDVLLKRENVRKNLNNEKYSLYEIDITDEELLEKVFLQNHIDCIIHLAAYAGVRPSIENPRLYAKVNEIGTLNIFEMAKKYDIKNLVCASSSSVYGNNKKIPFSEEDVVDFAISPYAATKKSNEVMGHVYHKIYGLNVIFLRFFTVYGPRQRPDLAINKFINSILKGNEIFMFGDGNTARDYTYIDDIVNGILLSINYLSNNSNVYEIINLGSNCPIKLKEMIEIIEKKLNKKANIKMMPMQPGDVEITYANIEKAQRLLGYCPSISFEKGIEKFIEWLLMNDRKDFK